jgi:hypothetical protein
MPGVKAGVTRLMKFTLAAADVIFCTINVASKVNLYENFQPRMIVCDEACRATEISTMSLFAFYEPSVWIFVGDHKQLHPVILSADREGKVYRRHWKWYKGRRNSRCLLLSSYTTRRKLPYL